MARKINKIILHHSASPRDTTTPELVKEWHLKRGFNDIGYHWMIDGNGELHKGRKESEIGAHCKGSNRDSIGVCVFGNFDIEEMTTPQENALCFILDYLMVKYELCSDNILPHRILGNTRCPGDNFTW